MAEYSLKINHGLMYLSFFLVSFLVLSNLGVAFSSDDVFSWFGMDSTLMHGFDNGYWALVIYVVAPFLFMVVLLHALLVELQFFNGTDTKKFQLPLAVLMAIMAIPFGVYSSIINMLAQFGTIMASVVFFAAFFGLGLSSWYRKHIIQTYGFYDETTISFTEYAILHLPIVFFGAIAGWVAGPFIFKDVSIGGLFEGVNITKFVFVAILLAGLYLLYRYVFK